MITDATLARWRLQTQHLVDAPAADTESALQSLLAVQAEQPGPTSWALGARTGARNAAELDDLLARGVVVRTHVLRPTWHYVHVEDLVWLLELTAPRVQKVTGAQLRVAHGLDGADLDRAIETVTAAVSERPNLTRPLLAEVLAARGLALTGQALMLLLAHAELAGHVCGGPPAGGEHTYAALASVAPSPRRFGRDDALAELALRYVTGHGPVTERDLAYWATLPLGDVRRGLAAVRLRLDCFEHDGRTYWHVAGAGPPARKGRPPAHQVSLFDEMYRGYQDSRWVLDAAGLLARAREPSTSIALADGQVVASVRRTVTAAAITFALHPYRTLTAGERRDLQRAGAAQAAFFGRTAVTEVVND